MITTGAHRSRVPSAFNPVLDEAVRRVRACDGRHSLYVYGSVATGTARVGDSDVDLIAVGLDGATALEIGEALSTAFSKLCRNVDVAAGKLSAYEGRDDESHGNRVFMRHYCVHLAGADVGAGLPAFPADRAAARGFNGDIGLYADRWRSELRTGIGLRSLGRRIARKTLLAVTGLVSIHDSTWTTDRLSAARRWGVVKPQLESALEILLAWGGGASGQSRAELQDVLDGVVTEVVDDFGTQIGLWHPAGPK